MVTECGRIVSCVHKFAVIAGEVRGLIAPCVRRFSCWQKIRLLWTSRAVRRRLLSAAGALKATSGASRGEVAVIAGEVRGLIAPCVRRFSCWRKVRLLWTSRAVHRRLLSAAGVLKSH